MTRVIGSTDVYSRKYLDRALDRLDRLRVYDKNRLKMTEIAVGDLRHQVAHLRKALLEEVE